MGKGYTCCVIIGEDVGVLGGVVLYEALKCGSISSINYLSSDLAGSSVPRANDHGLASRHAMPNSTSGLVLTKNRWSIGKLGTSEMRNVETSGFKERQG